MSNARWTQKAHLSRADEFVCSKCGASFPNPYEISPTCGSELKKTNYDTFGVDEAEGLSAFLDDDW